MMRYGGRVKKKREEREGRSGDEQWGKREKRENEIGKRTGGRKVGHGWAIGDEVVRGSRARQ